MYITSVGISLEWRLIMDPDKRCHHHLPSDPEAERIPYKGPRLTGVVEDLVVPNVIGLSDVKFCSEDDEKYWVPRQKNAWVRPLLFSLSQGYWVSLLRVRSSGIISRHRHASPVHATVLKGRWHYLEHDWWAETGSYAFEPPGDIHTLEVPEGCDDMITLFHVTGSYTYVDINGTPIGVEDVFTEYETARTYYEKNGVGLDYVESLVR